MERVLPVLESELHPVVVYRWFVSKNADLVYEGEPVSPRDWLVSGNDVEEVVRLAAAL
jgi:hypothetical protein